MKKRNLAGMMAVGVVAAITLAESASAITIRRFPGYFEFPGGEFTVFGTGYEQLGYATVATVDGADHGLGSLGVGFQTFCMEVPESFDNDPLSYTVEYYAIRGGGNTEYINPPGVWGDPISVGTAWLYDQFSRGVLAGYDYDPLATRSDSAELLQQAFWWLENEVNLTAGQVSANPYLSTVIGLYLGSVQDDNETHNQQVRGVAAINFYNLLENGSLEHRQSMLVRVPDGGLTVVLLGLGVLGCAALRRRMA